jgi:3-methylcrotonyl-CoA carboxylase alpha subunit
MKIKILLIANRGEIACRIARTARTLGITPVGVHSHADADSLHVREIGQSVLIGAGPASESYLKIEAVIDAARRVGADAIHPGYGFLAENPEFATRVEAAGMIFVGPTADTLDRFGDKASAKEAAIAANVPVVAGVAGSKSDPIEIAETVRNMGLPVLLKAVGGGGGRGQRLVTSDDTLMADIESTLREAKSTFGSEGMLLERFLPEARHVEIQIAGDGVGNVVHLFERDCTLQRRHQKVIEEAPAWGLPRDLLDQIAADAVRLGESLNYRGLGTVEFLVTRTEYFFLEVNPRIQVEHPVTEAITGLDLVSLQLRIAEGSGMGLTQDQITCTGHAIEARLYAENPSNEFAPSTGQITTLSLPQGIRIDSGVAERDEVSPFYDPMIAKLIVHAPDRETALTQMASALDDTAVAGVETNCAFLTALTRDPEFAKMLVHTRWIDARLDDLITTPEETRAPLWAAVAAVLFVTRGRNNRGTDPWTNRDIFTGWRLHVADLLVEASQRVTLIGSNGAGDELRVSPVGTDGKYTVFNVAGTGLTLTCDELISGEWHITYDSETLILEARFRGDDIELITPDGRRLFKAASPLAFAGAEASAERVVVSPLTGMIVDVNVIEGDVVFEGNVIAVLESMKMEISIRAAAAGIATNISVNKGMMVDRGQTLAEIAPHESE